MKDKIIIKGAKENNLKSLNIELDKHQLITFTGVSGSGKSSLVFDTIYASGQSSFYDTLSTYVVKNLPKISKPKVDYIENLSPCVMINQKPLGTNPRSTVGTVTEIYTYLRLLYSRLGIPIMDSEYFSFNTSKGACEKCNGLGNELVPDLHKLIDFDKSLKDGAIKHRTWSVGSRYYNIQEAINFFDMNKKIKDFTEEEINMLLYKEAFQYQNKSAGFVQSFSYEGIISRIMKRQADSRGLSINAYDEQFFKIDKCSECSGSRLNKTAREVQVNQKSLIELLNMELTDMYIFLESINNKISQEIIEKLLKELKTIIDLGLGYLTLNRSISTLSNGESQKIKIAKSINNNLNELIYILDEPSVGLHFRDIKKLVTSLNEIKNKGNTVLVVEHNRYIIENSDKIVDIGPGAGSNGGNLVYYGDTKNIDKCRASITAQKLNNKQLLNTAEKEIKNYFQFNNININNVENLDIKIPKNMLTTITGVSGSGKSSIVEYIASLDDKIIKLGGENIGRSSRSIVATYTKIFDLIRKEFANANHVDASLFSFNSKGACQNCNGLGHILIDMHFLGDIIEECDICHGKRYNEDTLQYKYKGNSISDILNMTIDNAHNFFNNSEINKRIEILKDLGVGYLCLGQSLDTLSGGELRRIAMIDYLSKKGHLYILDEPTSGLHLSDIDNLCKLLTSFISNGNTVIVIEHNLDFIIKSDYIIDIGPDSGKNGGKIIYQGYPKNIIKENSYTANAIKEYINN